MMLLDSTFQPLDGKEALVWFLDNPVLLHFFDDVVQLFRVFEVCFH